MFNRKKDDPGQVGQTEKKGGSKKNILIAIIAIIVIIALIPKGGKKDDPKKTPAESASQEVAEKSSESAKPDKEDPESMTNVELAKKFSTEIKVAVSGKIEDIIGYALEDNTFDQKFKAAAFREQDKPITSNKGTEFPYTFLITDTRKLKDSPKKFNYVALVGYKSVEDIKDFRPVFLEYYDDLTGRYEIIIPKEDGFANLMEEFNKALEENSEETK